MRYFTTEDVGKTRSKTPAGFLICHDVPIGRTGRMVYAGRELPTYTPGPDGTFQVDRYKEELFRPETIASFEGMPLTNDHPPDTMMNPKSFKQYTIGHIQNVRQGDGDLEDCLLADLFVMDKDAIDEIEHDDKVQVSAGYDAHYKQIEPGRLEQDNIVGNHTALVFSGRCGPRCSIGDAAPIDIITQTIDCNCKKGKTKMTRPVMPESKKALLKATVAHLQSTIDEEAPNVESEGGIHLHLHQVPPEETGSPTVNDKKTRDEDNNESSTKLMQMVDSLTGRMNSMEDVLADMTEDKRVHDARDARMKDAGETPEQMAARKKMENDKRAARDKRTKDEPEESEEDKKKREANDKRMRDGEATEEELKEKSRTTDAAHNSSAMESDFQETVALAAIIAPGVSVPTFDSMNHVATTAKSLCSLRRAAVKAALLAEATAADAKVFIPDVATLDSMPCASVRMAFNGLGGIIKAKNNSKVTGAFGTKMVIETGAPSVKGHKTPAEINAENAARRQKGWN